MAGKLFIHIGHYKTGTTALQVFCARNQAALRSAGLDYAALRLHNAKHSAFAFSFLQAAGVTTLMHGYKDPTPPETMWAELFDAVRASPAPAVLISSEEFMRLAVAPGAEERMAAILAGPGRGVAVEVIAYLRAPQPHLRSWYNQLVKMGQTVPDFGSALTGAIEPIHFDYGMALAPWMRLVGRDRLILRPYAPRSSDPARIYRDFLDALGIAMPAGVVLPEGDPNPRIDDRALDVLRILQNSGLPPRMIETMREQTARYFARQDALGNTRAPDLEAVRARAAGGLATLQGLPRSTLDLDALGTELPEADPAERKVDIDLFGLVLAEVMALRRRMNRFDLQALHDRVAVLEAAVQAAVQTGVQTGVQAGAPTGKAPAP